MCFQELKSEVHVLNLVSCLNCFDDSQSVDRWVSGRWFREQVVSGQWVGGRWSVVSGFNKILSKHAETVTVEEKDNIKIECEKYLKSHFYFKTDWESLTDNEKNRVLHYLSSRKGVIPYEEIKDHARLFKNFS